MARVLAGAARRIQRVIEARAADEADADPEASERVPQFGGMSLHADVAVPARDRRRLERLCRYVARPPLASERLEEREDGTLALRLKTRWRDGTPHILMERSELIERLVPLIPPPRAHQVRYHGVLAPSASLRDRIVPGQPEWPGKGELRECSGDDGRLPRGGSVAGPLAHSPSDERHQPGGRLGEPGMPGREHIVQSCAANAHERAGRMRWAALLQRVFEIDALRCPRCGRRCTSSPPSKTRTSPGASSSA